jgi:MYXO-CTERM domain-containing protein
LLIIPILSNKNPIRINRLKKSLLVSSLAALCFCSSAQAFSYPGVYSFVTNGANNSQLFGLQASINNWNNVTLTANATGDSYIAGTAFATNGVSYVVNITLQDAYQGNFGAFGNGNQYWGNFVGTLTGSNGSIISINDIGPNRDTSTDAVLGINVAPYNNGIAVGNSAVLELGVFGDNSPGAGGTRNFDINVHLKCISSTANANGTCSSAAVPLPGTLGLLGLAALGLFRRSKKA